MYLLIIKTWSVFSPLAVPAPHLLSPFPDHQPSGHWKSQITHLDMYHLDFGINFQIYFISLTSCVMILVLVHLSSRFSYCHRSQHPLQVIARPVSLKHWSLVLNTVTVEPAHSRNIGIVSEMRQYWWPARWLSLYWLYGEVRYELSRTSRLNLSDEVSK